MKNIAFYLAKELSKNHEVMRLGIREVSSWGKCKASQPNILHFILSPAGVRSFAVAKALALYLGSIRTVMSAPNPGHFSFRGLVLFLRPDLVLAQSSESENMFRNLGCKTEFLPNGVDTERFVPVSCSIKEKLREKYGIARDKFVILHVGPVKKRRNIQLLGKMQGGDNQIIIVARTSTGIERDLYQWLKERGCIIWTKYFKNIEEVYALSDCYVFPTTDKFSSVEMPLSVLEAMSCNLPVISTKFGALPRAFRAGDGLSFVKEDSNFPYEVDKVKFGGIEVKTRKKVLPYSWNNIAKKLNAIYEQLC